MLICSLYILVDDDDDEECEYNDQTPAGPQSWHYTAVQRTLAAISRHRFWQWQSQSFVL